MGMFIVVFVENGYYKAVPEVATRVQYLQRCVSSLESAHKYEEAEQCRQKIYDIMDTALLELNAYPVDKEDVA